MKKRKRRIEKTIALTTISSSTGLQAAYLREKGAIYQRKTPPPGIASSRCMTELLDAEIRLTFERWTCALDYVSAVINYRFFLFPDGPPLESLSSESLCAATTTPNQE
ncbi:hypothetical protein AYI68_g4271 [Smittium mucronatum]|uniref:Uncharacterized protein n=1 Tax=Smittium mucronatum TaxID=133383 RepID=A0A1R0GXP2_9FUNG|nr:hypothetical protein AYI68_g4271 [Smittium mucronatum]